MIESRDGPMEKRNGRWELATLVQHRLQSHQLWSSCTASNFSSFFLEAGHGGDWAHILSFFLAAGERPMSAKSVDLWTVHIRGLTTIGARPFPIPLQCMESYDSVQVY